MEKKPKVYVGLSGGVDSSVSALRLQQQGYSVVGVFIKTWHPDFLPCTWKQDREDAMRVAAHLGIPFMTFDAEAIYRDSVAQYMISEYQAGRTPNPDVMCNKFVKFGAFLNFARSHGAHVATGHYARVTHDADGRHLRRGVDSSKDQSYFLWTLSPNDLPFIHFPIGDSHKKQVREEARRYHIPTSEKHDSQGICFLGAVDIPEFLGTFITLTPGDVCDETGRQIGTHRGARAYTIGQRHGFYIHTHETASEPRYVIRKEISRNILVVSNTPPHCTSKTVVHIASSQLFNPPLPTQCSAQFRYRQTPFQISIRSVENHTYEITLNEPHGIELPSIGQSCVLYQGDECLGGGIISSVYENN